MFEYLRAQIGLVAKKEFVLSQVFHINDKAHRSRHYPRNASQVEPGKSYDAENLRLLMKSGSSESGDGHNGPQIRIESCARKELQDTNKLKIASLRISLVKAEKLISYIFNQLLSVLCSKNDCMNCF